MIGLGRALAARGHDVTIQTWTRWANDIRAMGIAFAAAPEYDVFPTEGKPLKPYAAVLRAALDAAPLIAELRPDAVVADILTLAPALAGELAGIPVATLIPHVHPAAASGFPVYSIGARLPRTAAGRAFWRVLARPVARGLELGRNELNETRRRLGLHPLAYQHGGISRDLCLVGSFPGLEYPRVWAPHEHVVGPLLWQPPSARVELPPGQAPLVVVAPSTSQDPEHRLLRATLEGLEGLPVRVLATWNRRPAPRPLPTPANARVLEWFSYADAMADARAVVCHGGHGTIVTALSAGAPVVACPAAGDMNENAARVDWAGAGVRVPRRLVAPLTVRLAVSRALADPALGACAQEFSAWGREHDAGARAAELIEELVARTGQRL